ncbi:MAG: fluoride efflux transporter CrcB [Pseudomonadota bacterium]
MGFTAFQVALGGAIGAVCRYYVGVITLRLMGPGFPWGTLAVNVIGSFIMGVLVVVLAQFSATRMAPFLMTGLLGGFTTFSAFSLDTAALFERGQIGVGAIYVFTSVVFALAAIGLGMISARVVLQ